MINSGMFTSNSSEHSTPQGLFDALNKEFRFTLDPCATHENAKCAHYFTKEENGLAQEWHGTVFMNPPYGREISKWVAKAKQESLKGTTVVCLLPARTDTRWWHDHIWDNNKHRPRNKVKIRLLKGRLKFGDSQNSAPFPSAIVIFEGRKLNGFLPRLHKLRQSLERWLHKQLP
jgi:phage N-6-adenine-methyltransferase